jgi:predicted phosphoribosyltransferase
LIKDRISAGEALADRIEKLGLANPVVVALPRGGVAVGVPIAKRLNAPLDLLFIKKIPAPGNPELALGSVAESGLLHLNQKLAVKLGVTEEYVQQVGREKIAEIARQRKKYQWEPVPLEGKDVIIVDDGIATGSSAYLALQSVVREYPKSITLAVPVAPEDPDLFKVLNSLTHNLIILETHSPFIAVGKWYEDFHQLDDGEVKGLLSQLQ